jgi:predicted ABC-type ATPase
MSESPKKPMVLVIAGPNGSGKSTITSFFETVGTYTNADDVVKSTGMSVIEAAKFVDKKRYESIEARKDFSFETVLSSAYKLDILKKAKENGYFIKCIFVLTVNPQINVERVNARVMSGGHEVPIEKIKSRYFSSLANIKKLIELCDILHVYDNSLDKPVRIIRKHKDDFNIFPNSLWTQKKIIALISD